MGWTLTKEQLGEALNCTAVSAQAALCVRPNDTPQTLAERVLVLEHEILPKTVAWVLDGHCTMEANHVTLDPSIIDDSFSFQR